MTPEMKQILAEEKRRRENWRDGDNTLNASPDHRDELDEIFLKAKHVHIERMDARCFWIGIDLEDGTMVHVRTGVARKVWFFRVEHDKIDGSDYVVQRRLGEDAAAELEREVDTWRLRAASIGYIPIAEPYRGHGLHAAYHCGFEHGYRAWEANNPYTSTRHRQAWDAGYTDGAKQFNKLWERRGCEACRKAAALASSDATTPGFIYDACEKHRQPENS